MLQLKLLFFFTALIAFQPMHAMQPNEQPIQETIMNNDIKKMRTFYQNKLWRDKLVEISKQRGSIFHMRELTDAEYDEQLRIKLAEETDEVHTAKSRTELVDELGDVFEVIDSLCALHGITREEIIAAQTKKRDERGGFSGRSFVETVEHPDGSFGANYCLAQPEKYPEIL